MQLEALGAVPFSLLEPDLCEERLARPHNAPQAPERRPVVVAGLGQPRVGDLVHLLSVGGRHGGRRVECLRVGGDERAAGVLGPVSVLAPGVRAPVNRNLATPFLVGARDAYLESHRAVLLEHQGSREDGSPIAGVSVPAAASTASSTKALAGSSTTPPTV